jgi:hypothetical protein
MFKITDGRGFQMTFENGWTVSVQFGFGNYCENQYDSSTSAMCSKGYSGNVESSSAEIAAWDRNGQWYDFGNDKVKGWVKADEVADFIDQVRKF